MASSSAVEDEHLTDSDLDDEEAQKEEQRQEEQRSLTPRPSYSDEELNRLVEFVQRMTTLCALNHRDWDEKSLDMIRRWLLEVNEPLLTVFYEGNKLIACLGLPKQPVTDLSYFLRAPNEIFNVDCFHDDVRFGTMHGDLDGSLLCMLELIYAPYFRNYPDWPENVRRRFCKSLDKFLTYLTALHFRMAGMAVLYVPYMLQQIKCEGAAFDKELVKNLEAITIYWNTQIRTLLSDKTELLSTPHDFATIADEYEFWQYRFEVLQGLNAQLAKQDVQQIIKVLRQAKSVYSQQIDDLMAAAQREMQQAKSNIKFLHLLIAPCALIDQADSPAALTKLLPRIIHLIRFIWLHSDHYNSPHLITCLFRNLSNQIISYCMRQTNVRQILAGSSRFGIKMCNMAIDCCLAYKGIYELMAQQHAAREPRVGWNLNEGLIFNHVLAFIERLNDVIDVCESMIVFARLDESSSIPQPQFGGTNGPDFERIAANVEEQFMLTLTTLRQGCRELILNVHRNEWYDEVGRYRSTVQRLEETVERLIANVFQHICNVEDALEALNAMLYYSYRSNLRKAYLRQVSHTWQLFTQELDTTARQLLEHSQKQLSWLPAYVSRALQYRINLERLSWLRDRLHNSEWLPAVPEAAAALLKFERLRKDFQREARRAYDDWQQSLASSAQALARKLDCHLIARSKLRKGLLECNVDSSLLEACVQAQHFEQLGFAVPAQLRKLFEQRDMLSCNHQQVMQLCLGYNRLVCALSERERKLFRALLQACERHLAPGIFKLTYATELGGDFVADCVEHTSQLQQTLLLYKRANRHVARSCEAICAASILQFQFTGAVALSVFESQLSGHVECVSSELRGHYNTIVKLLTAVQAEFQSHLEEMAEEWHSYVLVFDEMLACAFMTSARNSLAALHAVLHREEDMAEAPILVIESDIKERRIVLTPDVETIAALLSGCIDRVHQVLDQFARLAYKLALPKEKQPLGFAKVFRADAECMQLMQAIELQLGMQREQLASYVAEWQTHRTLWETTEKSFVQRVKATPMTAGVFEGSIEHYSALADDISFMKAIKLVHFTLINQNAIKSSVLDWLDKWQALNIKLLLEHATSLMRGIYRYMRRNERRLLTVPRTHKETLAAQELFRSLLAEVTLKQSIFTPMLELFVLLDKYHVKMEEKTRGQLMGVETAWLHYLHTLEEADEILDNNIEGVRELLAHHAEKFKLILREFLDDFYMKMPRV